MSIIWGRKRALEITCQVSLETWIGSSASRERAKHKSMHALVVLGLRRCGWVNAWSLLACQPSRNSEFPEREPASKSKVGSSQCAKNKNVQLWMRDLHHTSPLKAQGSSLKWVCVER